MGVTEFRIPDLSIMGPVTLVRWLLKDGAGVHIGDELIELESEKASVSVPAAVDGRLEHIALAGRQVLSGQLIGRIHHA
jgi:2-oxoglutarate dehydrogenase E2 component (dihydrolipoamide succinyltransferase)